MKYAEGTPTTIRMCSYKTNLQADGKVDPGAEGSVDGAR